MTPHTTTTTPAAGTTTSTAGTTTPWVILPTPAPADLAAPDAWAIHGAAAVSADVDVARLGHDDLASRAPQILGVLRNPFTQTTQVVAVPADAAPDAGAVIISIANSPIHPILFFLISFTFSSLKGL